MDNITDIMNDMNVINFFRTSKLQGTFLRTSRDIRFSEQGRGKLDVASANLKLMLARLCL